MSTDTSVPYPRVSGLDAVDFLFVETLLHKAPVGIAFFDRDLRFRRVSRSLAQACGVPVDGHYMRRPTEVWPRELAVAAEGMLRSVREEDRPLLDVDQRITTPATDGETRTWSVSCLPVHDTDGTVSGVALVAQDVTERRSVEEALRRSEERARSLVRASGQVVWVTSPEGFVREDAPEWRAITGQTKPEYLAQGWIEAVHPEDRGRVEHDWWEAVQTGAVFESTYRVRTRSGGYRYYDVRAVPLVRDGRIVEWVGSNTDVTAQREAGEMRHRLTEQLSQAALRTARLQQATSSLAEAITVEQVVSVITEVGRSAIGADRIGVALADHERAVLELINDNGVPDVPGAPGLRVPLDRPTVMTMAIRDRRPFLAESPESLREQISGVEEFLRHTDERAWIGLPLLAAGRSLGALRFAFKRPRKVSEEERVFLEALAGQCALAVERATLFEREHTTAETLQRSLLPERLPEIPGAVLAPHYRPGTRNVQVGGDWYDAFQLRDGGLAVTVGDVMGKGVGAAAGMGRVRNALRALALTDPRPAAVLTALDRVFAATEQEEQVTTMAYMVVDPATGEGLLGNAGHPPPLVIPARGDPYLVSFEPGTPLGWESPRQQHPFALLPGHTMVLYSDGLVENRRRGLDAGLEELLGIAGEAPQAMVADPEKLLTYLVERMLAGYEQDDDVTLLALSIPAG